MSTLNTTRISETFDKAAMEDIAIVGLGLRFPGDATSPEELWKVLEGGESQWSEFPKNRLNIDGYYHPGGDRQGSVSFTSARLSSVANCEQISFRGAHFLKGDVAAFDAPVSRLNSNAFALFFLLR